MGNGNVAEDNRIPQPTGGREFMQAVILAGGLGTRLRPLTLTTPKPLIPVFGTPVLVHQIELLKKHGVNHVVLCLNYRSDEIKKYFRKNPVKGVKIDFAIEPQPYGTAGAVKNAEPFISSGFFLVLNGDVLMDADVKKLVSFYAAKKAKAVLLLKEVRDPSRYGLVTVDSRMRIQQFLEKPSLEQMDQVSINTINAGMYVLGRDVLSMIPVRKFFSFERDVFPAILLRGQPFYGVTQNFYWIDMGTPDKYFLAHEDIVKGIYKIRKKDSRYVPAAPAGKNGSGGIKASRYSFTAKTARVGDGAELSGTVFIGERCVIGKKTKIKDSIIFNRVRIDKGATLQRCIVGNDVHVMENAFIENSVIGDGCVISGVRGM